MEEVVQAMKTLGMGKKKKKPKGKRNRRKGPVSKHPDEEKAEQERKKRNLELSELTPEEAFFGKDAKESIIRKRRLFEDELLRCRGPPIIPTLFRNHPERFLFVRQREKLLSNVRSPRNPPPEPLNKFTFADHIYTNLFTNFKQENFRTFIKPPVTAKIIHLKKESCGEEAFLEMLSRQPKFYSKYKNTIKLSEFVDQDFSHWRGPRVPCRNFCEFVVDFSMIFPEGIASTALVICFDCGKMVETVLCENALEIAKKELWHNICNPEVVFEYSHPGQSVIPLAPRVTVVDTLSFVDGLMGVATLTQGNPVKPSVFVRTRLHYFVNARSNFRSVVHDSTEDKEEDALPSHEEYMKKFNIFDKA